ncbi:heparinase II/III domain-containing protein [Paenibacillus sp. FA6]|uniref:heparinase II/III domain-containing protein n=1 Tax=Paenibacillus sp. FA6 TaxID=3413029 RepID=UPI003F65831D
MKSLLKALQYGTETAGGNGVELLFSEGRDKATWGRISTNSFYSEMVCEIRELGNSLLEEPMPVIPFSLYKMFDTTGDRELFQNAYFERRRRLDAFVFLSLLDEDDKYISALEDVLWAICDEYTWCLPAHLGGSLSLKYDEARGHREVLDLFATETAFSLSEVIHLLGQRLSEIVVHRVVKEIKERVLESYASLKPSSWWETTDMNWAAVCGGSIGATAMYLIQEDDTLAPLLHRVLDTMDCFLDGFAADGACREGVGYWAYGFGYFVYFAALLKQRTAGEIDLMQNNDKIKSIAMFQQKCYLSDNYVISYSDTRLTYEYQIGLTHYLKSLFEEIDVPPFAFHSGPWGDHCFRFSHGIRNLLWSREEYVTNKLPEAYYVLEEAQIFIRRSEWNGTNVAFSLKGGHNAEPHNHNDIGSFILHAGEQPIFVDPGLGKYTKEYFGDQRYSMIYNGSHGHSVPIIEGLHQQEGEQYAAQWVQISPSEEGDVLVLDLTNAYKTDNLISLTRSCRFDTHRLRIEDKYSFAKPPISITERFVTFIEPALQKGGEIVLQAGNGISAKLHYDYNELEYRCERVAFLPETTNQSFLYLIDLMVKEPKRENNVVVNIEIYSQV